MKTFLKQNLWIVMGVVLGALGGLAYWKWFGCRNGCAIKSNPYLMTVYGGVMGGLMFSFFIKKNKA
jgi:hypothetical protein